MGNEVVKTTTQQKNTHYKVQHNSDKNLKIVNAPIKIVTHMLQKYVKNLDLRDYYVTFKIKLKYQTNREQ
jgi:hypothetical protein